jgi:spore germination protein GerM
MKKLTFLICTILVYTTIFPKQIFANTLYYISYDIDMKEVWSNEVILLEDNLTLEEEIKNLFDIFFKSEKNLFSADGLNVLDVKIENGTLLLNVSKEVNNISGNFHTVSFIKQVIKTSLDINAVNKVTLYIDNILTCLPEGLSIEEESVEWKE